MNLVLVVPHNNVLILVMPKQRMSAHFDYSELTALIFLVSIWIVRVPIKIVELDGYNSTCLWVFDLKMLFVRRKLQPVVSVKLRDQISRDVDQCELLCVAAEHDLADVNFELLFLFCLFHRVKDDVVH